MSFIATRGFLGMIKDVVLRGFGIGTGPVTGPGIPVSVVGLIDTVTDLLGHIDDSALSVAGNIAQDSITGIIDPDAMNIRGLMQ